MQTLETPQKLNIADIVTTNNSILVPADNILSTTCSCQWFEENLTQFSKFNFNKRWKYNCSHCRYWHFNNRK